MRRARRLAALVTMMTAAACGSTIETAPRVDPATAPTQAAPAAPIPTLAERVEVDNLAILQGTTVTLVENAAVKKKRNAPVIAGRPALIRVHARSLDSKARLSKLGAELRITTAGKADVVVRETPKSLLELDDADLDTTFNFEIEAAALTPASALTVSLADPSAADDKQTFPTDGSTFPIGARDDAPALRVRFVPVRYDQDGSGRVPRLDPATIEAHRRALYTMYPTRTVEIDVRAPLPWPSAVDATGNGWDELLNAIIDTRQKDLVDDDVFYIGVFAPKASIDEYCGNGGCILGVAPAAQLDEVGLRVAMVVGYDSYAAEGTLAQELAHAMGREHAPCGGPDGPDASYPYPHARIGVAGWDVLDKTLIDPNGPSKDFMSYCGPVWISDYTYNGLYDRMVDVAKTKRARSGGGPTAGGTGAGGTGAATTRLRSYIVKADGSLAEGALVDVVPSKAASADITMRYEDAAGQTLSVSTAAYRRFDSLPGGILLAPEAPTGATRARVDGLPVRPLELRHR
jgi:hypothetical protein